MDNRNLNIVPSEVKNAIINAYPVISFYKTEYESEWLQPRPKGGPKYVDKDFSFTENHFLITRLDKVLKFVTNLEIYIDALMSQLNQAPDTNSKLSLLKVAIEDMKLKETSACLQAARIFFEEISHYLFWVEEGRNERDSDEEDSEEKGINANKWSGEENIRHGTFYLQARLNSDDSDKYVIKCEGLHDSVVNVTKMYAEEHREFLSNGNARYKQKLFDKILTGSKAQIGNTSNNGHPIKRRNSMQ